MRMTKLFLLNFTHHYWVSAFNIYQFGKVSMAHDKQFWPMNKKQTEQY